MVSGALTGALLLAHASRLVIPLSAAIELLSAVVLIEELATRRSG